MITLPYTIENCINCGKTSGNITFCYHFSNSHYVSCNDCYDYIQNNLIPEREFFNSRILHYDYYGPETEQYLGKSINQDISVPSITRTNKIKTNISLTSYLKHYIEFDNLGYESNEEIKYYVPTFFIDYSKRRRQSSIKMYDLDNLYLENPGIIGYYEIDKKKYSHLEKNHLDIIDKHNDFLFEKMLKHNNLAKLIIWMSNYETKLLSKCQQITYFFQLLPIEITYIIIKYALK
jgi:hypothetical protein